MKKNYTVAGLSFAIEAPQEAFEWLWNYGPFEARDGSAPHTPVEGEAETPFLFTLHVGDYPLPAEKKRVYVDSTSEDMPRIEMSRVGSDSAGEDDWYLEEAVNQQAPICMHLMARADFKEAWLKVTDQESLKFALDNSAMLLYAFTSLWYDALEMHASVPVKDGKGYLFLGKSGTGKSTHSLQWHAAFPDAYLLNDDNPIMRIVEGTPYVFGSPWSGKTPCYKNLYAPVGGIVKIKQAPVNEARSLKLPEAYAYMLSSASGLKVVPAMMDQLYEIIARIIQMVPVLEMACLPDPDAAIVCHDALTAKQS